MKVCVCDRCDKRIDDPVIEVEEEADGIIWQLRTSVKIVEASTKTTPDLCWDCFDQLRALQSDQGDA